MSNTTICQNSGKKTILNLGTKKMHILQIQRLK